MARKKQQIQTDFDIPDYQIESLARVLLPQINARDQRDLFALYQRTEREKQALQGDADVLREIREHAPDKLQEVMETIRQRKLDKYRPKPFKSSGNHWSK